MTTLTALIDARRRAGYGGDFSVVDDAHVRCASCGHQVDAEEIEADALDRIEGQTDPADESALLSLRCPSCGTGGTMVVRYGPEASAAEAALLRSL